jgi:hypothetical protein
MLTQPTADGGAYYGPPLRVQYYASDVFSDSIIFDEPWTSALEDSDLAGILAVLDARMIAIYPTDSITRNVIWTSYASNHYDTDIIQEES